MITAGDGERVGLGIKITGVVSNIYTQTLVVYTNVDLRRCNIFHSGVYSVFDVEGLIYIN